MKNWPWHKILSIVAGLLIFVGIAPAAFFIWWGITHNPEPLSLPLPLLQGEYTSPLFTTELDEDHQIDIYFLPPHQTPLDLDWKIVDEAGTLFQSGRFHEQVGGNAVSLERHYRPKLGSRHRIIVNMHDDIEAPVRDTRLHIGVPEQGLQRSYGLMVLMGWAALVCGAGLIGLIALAAQRRFRRQRN